MSRAAREHLRAAARVVFIVTLAALLIAGLTSGGTP